MWERIDADTDRMKVPGGWIVRSRYWMHSGCGIHQIFISDVEHTWTLREKP